MKRASALDASTTRRGRCRSVGRRRPQHFSLVLHRHMQVRTGHQHAAVSGSVQAEHAALLSLPAEQFACFQEAKRKVNRDGHVEVADADPI